MAEQLAKQTKGRAQIVLLGRNQAAADETIASFPRTPEGTSSAEESKYSFIKVDATSMEELRNVTSKLLKDLDKVNFIVVSPGVLTMKGRDETSEGIDRKMACNFYARFRFIYDLAPLVEKAAERGEQTGVMSVFAAGNGSAIDLDDLGLVKGFTLRKAHDHVVTYKDAVFEVSFKPRSSCCLCLTSLRSRNLHPATLKSRSITFSPVLSSRLQSLSGPAHGLSSHCSVQSPCLLSSALKSCGGGCGAQRASGKVDRTS
jgi:hypothetical protein